MLSGMGHGGREEKMMIRQDRLGGIPLKRIVTVLLFCSLGTGAGVIWAAVNHASKANENAPLIPDIRAETDGLIPGGIQVPLTTAQLAAPFPLYRPQDPAASDSTLTQVWVSTLSDANTVGFEYSSGLRAFLEAWPPGKDFEQWASGVSADTGSGDIETVHGTSAWVVAPDANWAGSPGSVEFLLGGVDVTLIEQGDLSKDDLLRIANSIA